MRTLQFNSLLLMAAISFSSVSYSQRDSLSFIALGDSYTVGTSEIHQYCWPVQLTNILSKKDILIKQPKIIAGAGWTSGKLLNELETTKLHPNYDIVSILIGVNNQYRNQNIKDFRNDFTILLEKSIILAKNDTSNVFVLSIPDWGVTPFARFKDKEKITKEISDYNKIIKEEAEKRNVLYIDITKLSRKALFDKSLIASDSLHPSRKMYKAWAKKINKQFYKKLE